MSRKALLGLMAALAGIVAGVLVPTGAFGGARATGVHTVILKNIRYHPSTLSINRGESVKWVWRDGEIEHTVTFRTKHSPLQSSGTYTVRFTRSGTFAYHCEVHGHEGMKGKIIVR
jgi:plastocyanin